MEDAKRSGFVPVYGRRRVGKSELIIKFMEGDGVYLVGKQAPGSAQIREFMEVSARALHEPLLADAKVTGWKDALLLVVGRWNQEKGARLILALDEFQWMAQASPELSSVLQELWDRDWSKSGKMLLILCGSCLGFMEKEVLGRGSPLFGRRTAQIHLRPFNHLESAAFHPGFSHADHARVYGICGGIPLYLEAWDSKQSVEQNIARLFLDETSILAREPDFLLREELRDLATYHAVLMEMAAGAMTSTDIAKRAGVDPRLLNYHLGVLCNLGYIAKHYPVSGKRPVARHVRYRLDDPVLRFWFRFVFPNQSLIRALGPQKAFTDIVRPCLDSWFGDCFERLCRECLPLIYAREGVTAAFETGQYWDARVQIDVVGIRRDEWIDLGECKWGDVSGGRAAAELEQKVPLFPNPSNATIGRRLFLKAASPRQRLPDEVKIHTLADLYKLAGP
jgi:AAA+ ATPase superfamily predicted ATPase